MWPLAGLIERRPLRLPAAERQPGRGDPPAARCPVAGRNALRRAQDDRQRRPGPAARPVAGAEDPLRERLSGRLMPALHRCGRQTDALSAFRHIRSELVERFGPEPSRELRRLERAILEHAPDLEVPAAGSVMERRRAPERARVPTLVAQKAPCRPDAPEVREAPSVSRVLSRVGRDHRRDHRVCPTGWRAAIGRVRTTGRRPGGGGDISELTVIIQPLWHSRGDGSVDTVRRQCRMFIPRCASHGASKPIVRC